MGARFTACRRGRVATPSGGGARRGAPKIAPSVPARPAPLLEAAALKCRLSDQRKARLASRAPVCARVRTLSICILLARWRHACLLELGSARCASR
eukprot:scaffold9601_cov123-Isochrysis_galbana.AAC.1